MQLIAQVKLLPTPHQHQLLEATLRQANAACAFASALAWETRTFHRFALQRLCYAELRARFALSAQLAIRVLAKVADAYRTDRRDRLERTAPHTFRADGAIAFDDRLLSWNLHADGPDAQTVSIWTLGGRQRIAFACGEPQRQLLRTRRGESDLVRRDGSWYLLATCQVEPAPAQAPLGVLGVDLGVRNLAVDSDGEVHSSAALNGLRQRRRRQRQRLQRKGTLAAKRRLRRLAGRERRMARDVNHRISKQIVAKAAGTTRALALEDLQGIRARATVRRSQRATFHSWSFGQLRAFLAYKAERAGVAVVLVDPRDTSRTCPACGQVDGRNRVSQRVFCCVVCGHAGLADHIAAVNISRRAAVNPPHVSRPGASSPGTRGAAETS
jgi:IS605 OrfB family transposase